jgi:FAD/FMN-containing dehydrogenase
VQDVGVGGLLSSGGVSFLTPEHGFACDNVRNYQVVNADGKVINVNQKSNPDLFWAMRGGGNNFGIITRFDVEAIPKGDMWGGPINYDLSQLETLTPAFGALGDKKTKDDKATTWFAITYFTANDFWVISE